MNNQQTRRKYLLTLGATSAVGLTGCSQIMGSEPETPENKNLSSADFSFEYLNAESQIRIRYDGGADIVAGELQIRSSGGVEVQWPQLGSTVASPDDLIEPGSTAVLGETILNWGEVMTHDDTIRLVHVGGDAPTTLGRYTPTEASTLTSTVPPTTVTPEASEGTTAPTTATPEAPEGTTAPTTATPEAPEDTTAPTIMAFSLSNPSERNLRTTFDSDERLSTIQVSISGAEAVVLTTEDFSETASGGTYTYEATYKASSDGSYTATLDEASDENGNNGAIEQSVEISVDRTSPAISNFSATNPTNRKIKISFESSEAVYIIELSISGDESTTLDEADFNRVASDGEYLYEATYTADSGGSYTLTLENVEDSSGNATTDSQSINIDLQESTSGDLAGDDFEEDHDMEPYNIDTVDSQDYDWGTAGSDAPDGGSYHGWGREADSGQGTKLVPYSKENFSWDRSYTFDFLIRCSEYSQNGAWNKNDITWRGRIDGNHEQMIGLRVFDTDGSGNDEAFKWVGRGVTESDSGLVVEWEESTWYHIQGYVDETTGDAEAKIWKDSEPEPNEYQISATVETGITDELPYGARVSGRDGDPITMEFAHLDWVEN